MASQPAYMGKIAYVDLTHEKVEVVETPKDWPAKYMGGEGFGAKILWDQLPPKIDPLSPVNLLAFTTGPLTGTEAPASGRTAVIFKSPLSGTIGASNVGGFFAPNLKKAGFDVLVVKGKARKPVYLWVHDETVEIKDATGLWGLDVEETTKQLLKETAEKASVACIGPAGENLVFFASIMVDKGRAAGRGGCGTVMGSKNLKAVVAFGEKEISIQDEKAFKEFVKKALNDIKAEVFTSQLLAKFGTPAFTAAINGVGILPTLNWQRTTFDAIGEVEHEVYHKKLEVKAWPCYRCPIACGRYTKITSGKYAGEEGHGPEYEGVAAFGSKCGVSDLNA
ncbi:MAG: aldehyde ferredoxin oxidoreductase N-terminal domain-containing protein, partial [Candidatus Hecatellaceae archaeon]